MARLQNGTKIYLKPICCLLSNNVFDDVSHREYIEYQLKDLVVCGTDSRYTNINIKNTRATTWFLDDAIDFNRKK